MLLPNRIPWGRPVQPGDDDAGDAGDRKPVPASLDDNSQRPSPGFTSHEMAAGRRLFAVDWQLVAASGTPASLPTMKGVELAFAGRSNVGKSSLINALTNRNGLARG